MFRFVQLRIMEPTEPNSEEEIVLIVRVGLLLFTLKSAGCPIDQRLHGEVHAMILAGIENKPLPDGIKKWRNREEQLQTLISRVLATSGEPAEASAEPAAVICRLVNQQQEAPNLSAGPAAVVN